MTLPNGHWYDADSETEVWTPADKGQDGLALRRQGAREPWTRDRIPRPGLSFCEPYGPDHSRYAVDLHVGCRNTRRLE
jgi:hypothetical protein